MARTRVAAIQMVSAPEVAASLEAAGRLVAEAAAAGARLAALPENFYIIGNHEGDKVKVRERDGDGPDPGHSFRYREKAPDLDSRRHRPHIHG